MEYTDDFKAAATADIREAHAYAEITFSSREIDPDYDASANDSNNGSQLLQTTDTVTGMSRKWAYASSDVKADGTNYPMPMTEREGQIGWFGHSKVCDASGNFTVSSEPELTVSFPERAITSATVAGDTEWGEYPVDFTVYFIRADMSESSVVITGNTTHVVSVPFSGGASDYIAVRLKISKWSKASTIVKIAELVPPLVVVFGDDDIVGIDILEEADSGTSSNRVGSVSSNSLELSLLNTDDRFNPSNPNATYASLVRPNRLIKVFIGFKLPTGSSDATNDVPGYVVKDGIGYMPYGQYYTVDWESSSTDIIAKARAFDIMELMRNTEFRESRLYSGTLYDIADTVLGIAKSKIPFMEFYIDPGLYSVTVTDVWFDVISFFQVLQLIGLASFTLSYVDRFGVLQVGVKVARSKAPPSLDTPYELDESVVFSAKPALNYTEMSNEVTIAYKKVSSGNEEEILEEQQIALGDGETFLETFLFFSKTPADPDTVVVTLFVSAGNPIYSYAISALGISLKINGIIGDILTISAIGRVMVVGDDQQITSADRASIKTYGVRNINIDSNTLVNSKQLAQTIASRVLSFSKSARRDNSVSWAGNLITSVGDTVKALDYYDSINDVGYSDYFLVRRQSLTFDGGLAVETDLQRYEITSHDPQTLTVPAVGAVAATTINGNDWGEYDLNTTATRGFLASGYGGGKVLVLEYASDNFAYSSDGKNWTAGTMPFSANWSRVAYGDGIWVAVQYNLYTDNYAVSYDGINWIPATFGGYTYNKYSVHYGGGVFVVASYSMDKVLVSSNGLTWEEHTLPASDAWFSGVFADGRHVLLSSANYAYSDDNGVTWYGDALPSGGIGAFFSASAYVVYYNGLFLTVRTASGEAKALYSSDGTTWAVGDAFSVSANVVAVAAAHDRFYAIEDGYVHYSYDGISWDTIAIGFSGVGIRSAVAIPI